jgi:hypothetical protein
LSDDLFHKSETRTFVGALTRSDEVEYDDNNSAIGHKPRADGFVMRTDHQSSRPTYHQQTETHLDDSCGFDSDVSRRAFFRDLGESRALSAAASGSLETLAAPSTTVLVGAAAPVKRVPTLTTPWVNAVERMIARRRVVMDSEQERRRDESAGSRTPKQTFQG